MDAHRYYRTGRVLVRSPYFYPVISLPIAIVVASIALAADASVDRELAPFITISAGNARTLFGGVAAAMITATAVIFWVRSALVQLASSQLSPRVLALYMHDRFQQASIGFLFGVFTYMVIIVLSLPRRAEADAPTLQTVLAAVLAVTALLVIILAIIKAVYATRLSEVLASIADETQSRVRATFPAHGVEVNSGHDEIPDPPKDGVITLTARSHGWIQRLDSEEILSILPPGATCWLDVRVGTHLTEDSHIGSLRLDDDYRGDPHEAMEAIRRTIWIESTRSLERDLTFGIRELVDVGLSALAPGTKDTTAGFEVILQVGIVLREILFRDLPPTTLRGDRRRTLYRTAELTHDDYVDLSFQQLRLYGSQYPSIANGLLSTLGMLKGQLQRAGLDDRISGLQRQGELVVRQMEKWNLLPADRERVYRMAVWHGFLAPAEAPSRELEEPSAAEQLVGHRPL